MIRGPGQIGPREKSADLRRIAQREAFSAMSADPETGEWSRVDLNSQTLFSSARRQLIVQFIVCELNFP